MAYTQKGMEFKTDPPKEKKKKTKGSSSNDFDDTTPVQKTTSHNKNKKTGKSYTQVTRKFHPTIGPDGPVKSDTGPKS